MSYQVLARKWRPKHFGELVGQEHVVNILANALSQNRLHHAYLFTGTRGVGKTTIARIFAKSLNCETGVSATPCGQCDICLDIDRGNFIDLLEIDAASRTKVDDTREILENVQYAPTRGRYKVYLIDEVHMLSRSSFNALLKTLEEPPEHVKFILATTDPQKLPITVLSRCLQFHLKALTRDQIATKLVSILDAESVTYEQSAIALLAKSARGSMRDSLSLTDQAIAQGQGNIQLANVQQMLGGIDQNWPFKILIALIKQDAEQLMGLSREIASYAPNYSRLFAEVIQLLHQVAMAQVVSYDFNLPQANAELLKKFAQAMSPDDVQLYYQLMVNGRKDLPYAGDEQAAFDMALLRLLAFKPVQHAEELPSTAVKTSTTETISFDADTLADTQISQGTGQTVASALAELEQTEPESPLLEDVEVNEDDSSVQERELAQSIPLETSLKSPPVVDESQEKVAIDSIEEESGEAFIEQQLAAEMLSIEQDAVQLTQSQLDSSEQVEPTDPNAILSEQDDAANAVSSDTVSSVEPDMFDRATAPQVASDDVEPPIATSQQDQTESEAQVVEPKTEEVLAQVNAPLGEVLKSRNVLRSRKKQQENSAKKPEDAEKRQLTVAEQQQANAPEVPALDTLPEQAFTPEVIDPATIKKANQIDRWANMIDAMALNGRLRQLAIQATIAPESNDDCLILCLNQKTKHLKTDNAHQQLVEFVSHYFNRPMTVEIKVVDQTVDDPYQIQSHINDKRYEYAKQLLQEDEIVQQLTTQMQAELDESTIVAK